VCRSITSVAPAAALHARSRLPDCDVTALANLGPRLGEIIGPAGNFSTLPEGATWLLSAAMLLGRLELFTVLVLFSPAFWRN
jgi:Trk-type K+ transport system membrane component